jgi:hypothetical protein
MPSEAVQSGGAGPDPLDHLAVVAGFAAIGLSTVGAGSPVAIAVGAAATVVGFYNLGRETPGGLSNVQ